VIDAGERPLPIAAEQIKRAPAESRRTLSPSTVEKTATVVNEAQPAPRRHVARWFVWVEPRQRLSPGARRTAVIFDDGGAFFLGVSPGIVLCYRLRPLFKLFKMFRSRIGRRVLNILNVLKNPDAWGVVVRATA
jgi:hypothetical protein